MLEANCASWLRPLLRLYPMLVRAGFRSLIQRLLMPPQYLAAARALDHPAPSRPVADAMRRADSRP